MKQNFYDKERSKTRRAPPARLADRLADEQRVLFVGRTEERAIFSAAIASEELPFSVLFICGPGGVGKTSLLHELSALCRTAGLESVILDARNVEATAESLLAALTA